MVPVRRYINELKDGYETEFRINVTEIALASLNSI